MQSVAQNGIDWVTDVLTHISSTINGTLSNIGIPLVSSVSAGFVLGLARAPIYLTESFKYLTATIIGRITASIIFPFAISSIMVIMSKELSKEDTDKVQ